MTRREIYRLSNIALNIRTLALKLQDKNDASTLLKIAEDVEQLRAEGANPDCCPCGAPAGQHQCWP